MFWVEAPAVQPGIVHIIKTLAFLSGKRIILMNWKQHKPNCFSMENWNKDFTDLLSMEQAALFLQDNIIPDELDGPWDFIRSCLEIT